jgi:hypothetical protein
MKNHWLNKNRLGEHYTLTQLRNDCPSALRNYLGKINSERFLGFAPNTVMITGCSYDNANDGLCKLEWSLHIAPSGFGSAYEKMDLNTMLAT